MESLNSLKALCNDYLQAIDKFECSEDGQSNWHDAILEQAVVLGLGPDGWDMINAAVKRREAHDELQSGED